MDIGTKALSDIVVYNKYAKYDKRKLRRENWSEIVDRYIGMMIKKYCGEKYYNNWLVNIDNYKNWKISHTINIDVDNNADLLYNDIIKNSKFLYDKRVLMSMRAAQFAGAAVERNETRLYNCSYLPINDYRAFQEIMFLLLSGSGVGFSVQNHDIEQLPAIQKPNKTQKFLVSDSIEGWADSIGALIKSYMGKRDTAPIFDYTDIRQKGELLITSGGKAPGPDPLRLCHVKIESLLRNKENGDKLKPIEVHDIICHIADAVLAGGIRRAALISLFSFDDKEMATCKHGAWWELNSQRGRANNSAVILRNRIKRFEFDQYWTMIKDSNSGEPGIYWTNDPRYGTNPCAEISLREFQYCNLTEINAGLLIDGVNKIEDNFMNACRIAAFFGTLQAGFTDFHYLRNIWKRNTEKDALIGVGITGICNGDLLDALNSSPNLLQEGSEIVRQENIRIANIIGINPAARTTTLKPSGTTSLVVGTSSGIHAWHSEYYIRNMQTAVGSDLYNYFVKYHPQLIKVMDYDPNSAVIGIPIKAPKNAILRENESEIEMLERVLKFNIEWVQTGHNKGPNTNNVSATVSVKDDNWDIVREWVWKNKSKFNGISFLPYDGGTYKDAPFQECTEEEYLYKLQFVHDINLDRILEIVDNTEQSAELACASGICEIL